MNRFEMLLAESGIASGGRPDPAERAAYFLWYHIRATGEQDADLEVVSAYMRESGTVVPELHSFYGVLSSPGQLTKPSPVPGKLRMRDMTGLDGKYKATVFEAPGLGPLYFVRGFGGSIIRIGSILDRIKYWPQRSWVAAWVAFFVGVLGFALGVAV